jgi:demethylmenaquinone methyltransferase/2-methoxy-6-polyprenyl-1,4-benzoquinol methylase
LEKQIVTPYNQEDKGKKEQVASMFDRIAGRYDFMNHFLSMGIDISWRKKAVKLLKGHPIDHLLDIATGTADLAIAMLDTGANKITGLDISQGMLDVGTKKIKDKGLEDKITLKLGDSENIPFEDASFEAITVSFGVRNFENLEKGLGEIYRVLKPNGKVVVLEFSQPTSFPFKQIYNFYFKYILPLIGRIASKDTEAYDYLQRSVHAFPFGDAFLNKLNEQGFKSTKTKSLTLGIASIYTGVK